MKPIISKSHLRTQKRLERHHGRLTAVVAPVGPGVTSAASASSRSVASAEAAMRAVPVVVSEIAAAVMVIPLIMW